MKIKKVFFSSLLMIFVFFNQMQAITSAQASKMIQEAERAKKEIAIDSQMVFEMLKEDITIMDKTQLNAWKTKLRDSLRQMNKDANIVVGTPLVVPQGTEIPKELQRAEKEGIVEISKGITSEIVTLPPSDIPAPPIIQNTGIVPPPSDIPEPPKIVEHEEKFDDFAHFINILTSIKLSVKKTPDKKNIGLFNFTEWFKEIDSIEQEMKTVHLTSSQIIELQTFIKDIKPLMVNSCAQWIIADLNSEFSGPQAQFHLYFTMIQDWLNDPNSNHAKKMIESGSEFDASKAQIKQRIMTLSFEIKNHLELIIKNTTLLTVENRDLIFTKILEYIYGTFEKDTLPGKANIDRSLFAIVQEAIKYINHAFTEKSTTEEKQAIAYFDDAIISPIMLTMFTVAQTLQKSSTFDKNKVTSIYNAIKNMILPEREKIEKKFGYHEEW